MTEANRELFERAARGDREAFWQLVLPFRGLVYSVALGMLKDREQAEDQLHDVLVAAQGALANLRDPAKLPSWLYSITRFRIMERQRKEHRLRGAMLASTAQVVPVAEMLEKEAWLTQMEAAMGQLPEPFRVILALKYMNDFSCAEIAEILDLTVAAVKSRLFEARKLLRKLTESSAIAEEKGQAQ
jgi:RNA polymerase sigma-70 factor (ECF subfamily)